MVTTNVTRIAGVFFCIIGWVCINPAIGAEDSNFVIWAQQADGSDSSASTPSIAEDDSFTIWAQQADSSDSSASTPSLFDTADDQQGADGSDQTVNVGSFGMIELHVDNLEISKVLQLLSLQAERNIVVSRQVSGAISADLYEVDFFQALDAILHTNGFGYRESGTFIYVYTADELQKIIDSERTTVTRVVRLNWLTAGDASTYVTPLLSAGGSIAISGEVEQGFQANVSDGGENTNGLADVMVIKDYPENIDEIMAVLEQLDVRPKQVLVEAIILQARLNEANAFGVDISAIIDFDFAGFTDPLAIVDDLIAGVGGEPENNPGNTGQAVQTTPGQVATGPSSIKVGLLGSNIQAFIRALDSVTDTTVLANPRILAVNRQKADLLVGERLGYLSTTNTDTSSTQTVEFLDVGTQLSFRAFIGDDDFIRLELRPSVSDGSTELRGGTVIPNENTNELTTNVIVRSGQTVVLGGLFKEDTKIAIRQVPGLGDVPLLGAAFRGHDDTVTRSEVIFLITPTIVHAQGLANVGNRAADSVVMATMGAKQGLLPWSRTKMTTGYMRDAIKYRAAGSNDKALWAVNMALRLDPTIVEGLRMKEQLTGEHTYWPDRSILRDAINQMIDRHVEDQEAQILQDQVEETFADPQEELAFEPAEQWDGVMDIDQQPIESVTEAHQIYEPVEPWLDMPETSDEPIEQWIDVPQIEQGPADEWIDAPQIDEQPSDLEANFGHTDPQFIELSDIAGRSIAGAVQPGDQEQSVEDPSQEQAQPTVQFIDLDDAQVQWAETFSPTDEQAASGDEQSQATINVFHLFSPFEEDEADSDTDSTASVEPDADVDE